MILCVGLAADQTFCHTLAALRSAAAGFDVVELAQFYLAGDLVYPLEQPSKAQLDLHGHTKLLERYESAFVRLHDISAAAPSAVLGVRAVGIYLALGRLFTEIDLPVINPPFADNSNFSKPFHALQLARLGWSTPRTCLTDDPQIAADFIDSCGGAVILKGVSSMKTWAVRYDAHRDRERLRLIRNGPALLQEEIKGPDVRVHVLDERIFAELIDSDAVDYRRGRGHNRFRQITLPRDVADRCRAVAEFLHTPFVGIDLKRERLSGEWLLLEANGMPGYDGYDRRADGAISAALVRWLRRRVHPARS
jgi:glutathione synthase/RimK-type ligase-like ATP-grasp enzyme